MEGKVHARTIRGRRGAGPFRAQRQRFLAALTRWYARHGRHDLPWRLTRDPYAILVSEVMLQQTQASRVTPKFRAWMTRFPTIETLAAAAPRDVLAAWSGLGYNRRGRNLQRAAREILHRFQGAVPRTVDTLLSLPGVGPYTAAAVRAFAFNLPGAAVDVNVSRVLGRVFSGPRALALHRATALTLAVVPTTAPRRTYSALMDVGALVCTAQSPRCTSCPMRSFCPSANAIRSTRRRTVHERPSPRALPRRLYRGRVVRVLVEHGTLTLTALGQRVLPGYHPRDRAWLVGLVEELAGEGLVVWERTRVELPRT